jgi:hypothetical protein
MVSYPLSFPSIQWRPPVNEKSRPVFFCAPFKNPVLAIHTDKGTILEQTQLGFGIEAISKCIPPTNCNP